MVTSAPPRPQQTRRRPSPRRTQAEAARFRRSLLLVGLSALAPGSAQLLAGNKRLGTLALRVWAGIVIIVALVVWQVPLDTLAGLAVRPWLLTFFKAVTTIVAIAWIVLLIDAWRIGKPPSLIQKHRLILLGATLGLIALVATPFVVATRYASAAHDTVVSMFASGDVAAAADGRLNIVLLGGDAGDGRLGNRPDSIHLVSLDVRTGLPVLISLPRNLEKARFPDGTPAGDAFPYGFSGDGDRSNYLLNATWTYGVANPDLFPGGSNPGAEAVKQAVSGTLGIPVHYYVIVDLQGFQDLVDAVGGITITAERDVPIAHDDVIPAGVQQLDGYHALWYARSRTGSDDYDRMARQRCVLGAMLHELDPGAVLSNFVELLEASESLVATDIPYQQLPDLMAAASKAKDLPLTSLQLVPPLIVPADPDVDVIANEVQTAFATSLALEDGEPGADESSTSAAGESDGSDDAGAVDGTVGEAGADETEPATALVGEVCSYG
jgi:LCP family protein required for cell wall assembly